MDDSKLRLEEIFALLGGYFSIDSEVLAGWQSFQTLQQRLHLFSVSRSTIFQQFLSSVQENKVSPTPPPPTLSQNFANNTVYFVTKFKIAFGVLAQNKT